MPYSTVKDLPDQVRNALPTHAQEIYLATFNSAFHGACKDRDNPEECCAKIAWAAVKRSYQKDDSGQWQPTKESADVTDSENLLETSRVPVKQRFIREDGTARIRIISPGWGSSGYYSREVLKRDGPKVYVPGTKQYLDHPTLKEEKERPERSLRDLVAVITGNVAYESEGTPDEGVYADIQVFSPFRVYLNEIAQFIGISHRSAGTVRTGAAEGRNGRIIESLTSCQSIDFVTAPGRGGAVVPLFESWRAEHVPLTEQEPHGDQSQDKGGNTMGDTIITKESLRKTAPTIYNEIREEVLREVAASEATKLKEAEYTTALKENTELKDKIARLQEAQVLAEAAGLTATALEKTDLPAITKDRLRESLPKLATVKDGKLDVVAFAEAVKKTIADESAYIAKIRGTGTVRGMGSTSGGSAATLEESQKVLVESFRKLGMTENEVKIAAAGRL